jgi:hypothetical protein
MKSARTYITPNQQIPPLPSKEKKEKKGKTHTTPSQKRKNMCLVGACFIDSFV